MKKLILVLTLVVVCCLGSTYLYAAENQTNAVAEQQDTVANQSNATTDQPTPAENQLKRKYAYGIFSIGGGGFFPQGDLDKFDNGYNGTFSAGATFGRFIGVSIDFCYRESEAKKQDGYDANKINTFNIDYLVYFQPNDLRVQPYIAVGFGLYFNHLDNWQGMELYENSGTAYGVVGKAGIRFFLTENLFIGAYGKYFTNWQEMKIQYYGHGHYEENKTFDLGGLDANIELGFKF